MSLWMDFEVGRFFFEAVQVGEQRFVQFNDMNRAAAVHEIFGEFSVAGADFDPAIIGWRFFSGVNEDANGLGDLLAPGDVGEEMLA